MTNFGGQLLAPVFIDDIGRLAADSLVDPAAIGQVFEIGGPETLPMRDVIARALRSAGIRRPIIPGPAALIRLGAIPLTLLPSPPLTPDAVDFINQPATVDLAPLMARMPRRLTPLDEGLDSYLGPAQGPTCSPSTDSPRRHQPQRSSWHDRRRRRPHRGSHSRRRARALFRWNAALALLHGVQFVVMLLLSLAQDPMARWPIVSSYLTFDQATRTLEPAQRTLFELPIGPAVAAFFAMSALAHIAVAFPARRWYERRLARHQNPARWIEYAFSSSVMIVVIAMLTGVREVGTRSRSSARMPP